FLPFRYSFASVRSSTKRKPVKRLCCTALASAAATISSLAGPDPAPHTRLSSTFMTLPLVFEPQEERTDSETQFAARGSGYTLSLTGTEVVLVLAQTRRNSSSADAQRRPWHDELIHLVKYRYLQTSVVRMKFAGGNCRPRLIGRELLAGKSHYFIGND